jgi:exonuclease VII small subunit
MKVCIKKLDKGIDKKQIEVISSFIKFLQSQVPLSSDIQVVLTNNQKKTGTTGVRMPGSKIYVLSKGRMLVDILRTLSHEWVHEFQYQKMGLDDNAKIQDIGGPEENMCNILSGIFIKKFDKQNPDYKETIYEQSLINELSPKSTGVDEVIKSFKERPELLKHLGFRNLTAVKHYIEGAGYEDFDELRHDIEEFYKNRDKYFEKEMDEFERVVQDLSRDEGIDISVDDVVTAFKNAKETTLTNDVWSKLENTESNQIKKGEIKKVIELAKKYNKSNPMDLKKALKSGDYPRPMILKYGDRYHLVAGNTRLCTAAALGMKPQVLIAEI